MHYGQLALVGFHYNIVFQKKIVCLYNNRTVLIFQKKSPTKCFDDKVSETVVICNMTDRDGEKVTWILSLCFSKTHSEIETQILGDEGWDTHLSEISLCTRQGMVYINLTFIRVKIYSHMQEYNYNKIIVSYGPCCPSQDNSG